MKIFNFLSLLVYELKNMSNSILQIQNPILFDSSISEYEYHTLNPYNTNSYESGDEIRILSSASDFSILPSESYLRICGRIVKNTAPFNTAVERTKFVNLGCCHLFREMRFAINNVTVDENKNCGITTLMKNYLTLSPTQSNLMENASWNGVNETTSITDDSGYFDCLIPLKMLFGLCSDYSKIFISTKMELTLIRSNSDANALITTGAVEDCKVLISKIEWNLPFIRLNERERVQQLGMIAADKPIQVSFRSWNLFEYPILPTASKFVWTVKSSTQLEKPRYVILGLQTDRKNNTKNASRFDRCNIRDVKVYLNATFFPYQALNLDFSKSEFSNLYQMYANFSSSFFGKNGKPLLTKSEFLNHAMIFPIDCSRQSENLNQSSVDLRVEIEASENFPANTAVFAIVINDSIFTYSPMSTIVRKM